MCANVTPPTLLSSHSATARSLLSRLTSPLKTRTRNLLDFHIQADEPHRQYSPGDLVKGAVILKVVKPIRLTHLTVCLHGFVRVFKHPNAANETFPIDAGLTASSNPSKSQYFGNGHASLFKDEQTLCGEGRLDTGEYHFNFLLEFPSEGLPTSIDFERGTISYMITATITRPTSIAATSTCDQKISLVETVDIGPMVPPKAQKISLEPIARRTRRKKTTRSKESGSLDTTSTSPRSERTQMRGSPSADESASICGSIDHQATPQSPVPSEIQSTVSAATSADSTVSSSTGLSFRLGPAPPNNSRDSGSTMAAMDKTITATIELLKSGCLPGDNLPLKISIKHTKAIKSMHGIIITLYRQGRIDSAPPLSLFTDIKGKQAEKMKHEEYYPKSKTGLGGLSLSSAGSSSLFRKDLAQTFAPILVDPNTLTAVVQASVRVPEDVFPTIQGVPGQMINFKYHVEVVVDLGGKLAGQQRHLPRVGAVTLPASYGNSSGIRGDGNPNLLAAFGGSIVDTDHIRREKSVVACLFEVIVGTTDSARGRGRGSSFASRRINDWAEEPPATPPASHGPIYEEEQSHEDQEHPYNYYDQPYEDQYHEFYSNEGYDHYEQYPPPVHAEISVPPPEIQAEQNLNEKERLRRAEERLLPSQPPTESAGPSSSRAVLPSAPFAPPDDLEEDIYSYEDATPQANSLETRSLNNETSPGTPTGPTAPALEDLHPLAKSQPTEDKQELERRRLLAEASAPSAPPDDDEEDNGGESSSAPNVEPSAPTISENDEYGGQYSHNDLPGPSSRHEALPRYER